MRDLIVVDDPDQWPEPAGATQVVSSLTYLADPAFAAQREPTKIVNLCGSYDYQTIGYYVSLLAAARGHRVTPSASAIRDVEMDAKIAQVGEELEADLRRALKLETETNLETLVSFGVPKDERLAGVARKLFGAFHLPLMVIEVSRSARQWKLTGVRSYSTDDLNPEQRAEVLRQAESHMVVGAPRRRTKSYRYDMAILWDPEAVDAPSNRGALSRFEQAAEHANLRAVRITAHDYGRLAEFDALFIRETTSVEHHTFRFAQRAALEGLVVVDDPESILRCSNKVFLAELLARHRVPHPRTWIVAESTLERIKDELPIPCVLKPPDGCFSQGIVKVRQRGELVQAAEVMFERSQLILAQDFVPTDYDWRVGVLDGRPLYACRYYMAKNHWQIIKRDARGREHEGAHETLDVESAPKAIVQAALRACRPIGRGLYGVDVKEREGKAYVIEVNDNPNLDAGVEDQHLGDALYRRIITWFIEQIEARKAARRTSTNARRIPQMTAQVVPEPIASRADYDARILQPLYAALAPHDPEGVLRHEWANARGAIVRFDRSAIEIRLVDAQECPRMDLAVAAAVVALVRDLVQRHVEQSHPPESTERLAELLRRSVADGDAAVIDEASYLQRLGLGPGPCSARDVWSAKLEALGLLAPASPWSRELEILLAQGPLARRIRRALPAVPGREDLHRVYSRLVSALSNHQPFVPNEALPS